MKSLCFFIPIVHEAEIDSVNRAVELIGLPIGLQIGRLTSQQEKIQRTEEKRCTVNHVAEFVKRNSDSQRTEVQRYTEPNKQNTGFRRD